MSFRVLLQVALTAVVIEFEGLLEGVHHPQQMASLLVSLSCGSGLLHIYTVEDT